MDYNDQELLDYIQCNNEEALNILCQKYEPYIYAKAKKFLRVNDHVGLDLNDLLQEGRLALNEAIYNYNESQAATFYTYAITCIDRKMISSLVMANRLKHKFLNESISFEQEMNKGVSFPLKDIIISDKNDPLRVIMQTEREQILLDKLKSVLTDFEYQVFELKYNNFNYREIAQILEREEKAIDNALQRIKSKTEKILNDEKI
jgi:RNA polymerase sporulation-specific sigma factor